MLDAKVFKVYCVVTMFIDDQTYERGGKTYRRVLMRNSFRVDGRVRHETVANLSKCEDEEIEALKLALKHKGNLKELASFPDAVSTKQGQSVGALFLLQQLANKLGITQALGGCRQAKLVLWLVFAATMEQGSRLSAARLAQRHAVCDLLNLESFNEDDLYSAMDWLAEHQTRVEKRLFDHRYGDQPPRLYLYDVTSSYLEGTENELAAWGYNRDKKKGKLQIVIGLLTDALGRPVSIEVFPGNTNDLSTFGNQVQKVRERFDGHDVVFVGDRGMIKGPQIEGLPEDFHYVSAISKPQIEKLLVDGVFQMELFDETLCETVDGSVRYVVRRNPVRARELAETRDRKRASIESLVRKKNEYLRDHPRAKALVAKRDVQALAGKLKFDSLVEVRYRERTIVAEFDEQRIANAGDLDGCYAIKTDLVDVHEVRAEEIHDRYMELTEVEWAFRTMKTVLLEMRGIFVRKEGRTRAHVFIIMLAYLLAFELRRLWRDQEVTVEEGLRDLAELCATEVIVGNASAQTIPEPRDSGKALLEAAGVSLPEAIPCRNAKVVTRKKLVSERRSN
jgi:transposase